MKRELEVKENMVCSNQLFIFFVAFQCAFLLGTRTSVLKHHPNYTDILSVVTEVLPNDSFEVYEFKVDWYNKLVDPKFRLNYHKDTAALSTFMTPRVFEQSFVSYLCEAGPWAFDNSWSKFTKYYMEKVQIKLWEKLTYYVPNEDILYPGHMLGPGHPAILVQTAGHVAGAAYYYQRKDIKNDPWPKNETIYGVSIHPLYGGWFYMGPVIILDGVTFPATKEKKPKDVLVYQAKKIELLNLFNEDWQDQRWRDIICATEKFTVDYLAYRMAYGSERTKWVTNYYEEHCIYEQERE